MTERKSPAIHAEALPYSRASAAIVKCVAAVEWIYHLRIRLMKVNSANRELDQQQPKDRTIDPVCGMTVDPQKAAGSFVYKDQTYFFCSLGCRERFSADPERFLNTTRTSPIGIGHMKRAAITYGPDTSK